MKRRSLVVLLLGVMSVLGIGGCARQQQGALRLGFIGPLTGAAASYGTAQKNGMDLAVEQINAAGGVNGRKLEIVYEDSQMDTNKALSAIKKLTDIDKVPVVFGETSSAATLAIAPIAKRTGTVLLSPLASSAQLSSAGIFRLSPSDTFQAGIAAKFARDKGWRSVAVIYTNDDWGSGLQKAFAEDFAKAGGRVLRTDATEPTARDFRTQLAQAVAAKPDFLYIPVHPDAGGPLLRQATELGVSVPFLGTDSFGEPTIVQVAGTSAEGIVYVMPTKPSGGEWDAFAQAFKAKYGKDADYYAAAGYDAVKLIAKVVSDGGDTTPKAIREKLAQVRDYQGASGVITFDANGDVVSKSFQTMVIRGGKGVPVEGAAAK